jgi:hypothetical protein
VKRIFFLLVMVLMCVPGIGRAQANFSPSELDTLVSNIALYPDPLLVHVLTASTFGNEIPAANAWAQGHRHLKGESLAAAMENDNLSYDPSVQALLPFPTVLEMMSKYRAWCDQLGDAVTNQKDDVMEAIQRMRQSAYDHGHLRSDERVQVAENSGNIVITPVKTEVVYVPVYNPRVVYYVYADGYTRITYGSGVWLGAWYGEWGWGTCWFDWGPRVIYVRNTRWYAHRPIPRHPRGYRPPPRPHNPPPHAQPHHNPPPAHNPPPPRMSAPPKAKATVAPAPQPTRIVPEPQVREVPRNESRPVYPVYRSDDEDRTYGNDNGRQGTSTRTAPSAPRDTRSTPPRQGGGSGRFGKVIRR